MCERSPSGLGASEEETPRYTAEQVSEALNDIVNEIEDELVVADELMPLLYLVVNATAGALAVPPVPLRDVPEEYYQAPASEIFGAIRT